MGEGILYLVSSFWLGALHAATPGHGKTIAASYIVGVRGRPVDALVLGIFVTLSHTSGIILVAVLATLGSTWLIPQRVEAYLAVGTGMLVVAIGMWMVRSQLQILSLSRRVGRGRPGLSLPRGAHDLTHGHDHDDAHDHAHHDVETHAHGANAHDLRNAPPHHHDQSPPAHDPGYHRHGWGLRHTHNIDAITQTRPRLAILLGLGVAGGLLPDPGALAILLAAIASGKLVLGLFTVLIFSLGFASVLVVVGIIAARVGQLVLMWLSSRWMNWLQMGAALLIICVGLILTVNAWRTVTMVY
jgi:nickel/cobalt transporter (NicO) family protein